MAIAPGQLPAELVNLLALHSSFLTALSLHYAHNGTSTPADLRDLTASITLVWKQRQVTYDDIRLLMGVLSYGPDGSNIPYTLSDYGRGKIVLEIKDSSPMLDGMTGVNEQALTDMSRRAWTLVVTMVSVTEVGHSTDCNAQERTWTPKEGRH